MQRPEDLLYPKTETAAAAVPAVSAGASAPPNNKDKGIEQPGSYRVTAEGAGPSQPQAGSSLSTAQLVLHSALMYSVGCKYHNVCYTCPVSRLHEVLWKLLRRPALWAKAGACVANVL